MPGPVHPAVGDLHLAGLNRGQHLVLGQAEIRDRGGGETPGTSRRYHHLSRPAAAQPGGPAEMVVPPSGAGRFTPAPVRDLRLTKEQMLAAVESGVMQIADCRMDRTWHMSGAHIPGAVRLPAPSLVQPGSGTVQDAAGVHRLLAEAGLDAGRPIALYCGGGVSAAEAFMALRMAGIQTARVYDGSWTEWGADPATPKAPHSSNAGTSRGGPAKIV